MVADGPGDTAASEFVMVFNGSDADIDLTGWMVQDTSPLNAYFFPKGSSSGPTTTWWSTELGHARRRPRRIRDDRYFYAGTDMPGTTARPISPSLRRRRG